MNTMRWIDFGETPARFRRGGGESSEAALE
jgi:hypothetical protein